MIGDLKMVCTVVLLGGIIPNFVDKHMDLSHSPHPPECPPKLEGTALSVGQMSLCTVISWAVEKLPFCQATGQSHCENLTSSLKQPEPLVIRFLFLAFWEIFNIIFTYLNIYLIFFNFL